MAKVQITSQLALKLGNGPLSATLLITRFSEWKRGDEYASYWFGQTKTENGLTHSHMAPFSPGQDMETWNLFWDKRQPHRRRSDCYVLYAFDPIHGYLLIDVLFDPGAHALWKPAAKQQLNDYESVADNFIFAGIVP